MYLHYDVSRSLKGSGMECHGLSEKCPPYIINISFVVNSMCTRTPRNSSSTLFIPSWNEV